MSDQSRNQTFTILQQLIILDRMPDLTEALKDKECVRRLLKDVQKAEQMLLWLLDEPAKESDPNPATHPDRPP